MNVARNLEIPKLLAVNPSHKSFVSLPNKLAPQRPVSFTSLLGDLIQQIPAAPAAAIEPPHVSVPHSDAPEVKDAKLTSAGATETETSAPRTAPKPNAILIRFDVAPETTDIGRAPDARPVTSSPAATPAMFLGTANTSPVHPLNTIISKAPAAFGLKLTPIVATPKPDAETVSAPERKAPLREAAAPQEDPGRDDLAAGKVDSAMAGTTDRTDRTTSRPLQIPQPVAAASPKVAAPANRLPSHPELKETADLQEQAPTTTTFGADTQSDADDRSDPTVDIAEIPARCINSGIALPLPEKDLSAVSRPAVSTRSSDFPESRNYFNDCVAEKPDRSQPKLSAPSPVSMRELTPQVQVPKPEQESTSSPPPPSFTASVRKQVTPEPTTGEVPANSAAFDPRAQTGPASKTPLDETRSSSDTPRMNTKNVVEAEINAPTQAQPARQISLKLTGPGSAKVDVELSDRRGTVQVAVRTADRELAKTLQGDLGDLVGRLENKGYKTEAWIPGDSHLSEASEGAQSGAGQGHPEQSGARDQQQSERQDPGGSNHRREGRWARMLEESTEETKE